MGHLRVTIAAVGASYLEDQNCRMQGPVMGKTLDNFSSQVNCIAPSSIMESSQKGSVFLEGLRLRSGYPAAEEHGIIIFKCHNNKIN